MINQEELLLEYWRTLSPENRDRVLAVARSLIVTEGGDDRHAPEHLNIHSSERLEQLLLEGIDSLDRDNGIEVTDEWWESERLRLVNKKV